jgi:membrane protein CcdC involved in cytochrome C biogenesis
MTAPFNPSLVVPIGIGALVLWRFYSRARRMVGRQQLSNVRPWITVCVFPILTVLLAMASVAQPMSPQALLAGIVVGICLGVFGLRTTRFETTPQGLFYTPNAHLGIALSLLLLGRIIYRLIQVYSVSESAGPPQINSATTPLTLLIFGTLAGYYVTYAVGLLRWQRGSSKSDGSAA